MFFLTDLHHILHARSCNHFIWFPHTPKPSRPLKRPKISYLLFAFLFLQLLLFWYTFWSPCGLWLHVPYREGPSVPSCISPLWGRQAGREEPFESLELALAYAERQLVLVCVEAVAYRAATVTDPWRCAAHSQPNPTSGAIDASHCSVARSQWLNATAARKWKLVRLWPSTIYIYIYIYK